MKDALTVTTLVPTSVNDFATKKSAVAVAGYLKGSHSTFHHDMEVVQKTREGVLAAENSVDENPSRKLTAVETKSKAQAELKDFSFVKQGERFLNRSAFLFRRFLNPVQSTTAIEKESKILSEFLEL